MHCAYLNTRDTTIPKEIPTKRPTVHMMEWLDVGLDQETRSEPAVRKVQPPVGTFICGYGIRANTQLLRDRERYRFAS